MRILWVSIAPWVSLSGYGNQTGLFVPRLIRRGHSIAIAAMAGVDGGALTWDGVKVYPKFVEELGQDVWAAHASAHRADIVLTLHDSHIINPDLLRPFPWVAWAPIDCESPPPLVRRFVRDALGLERAHTVLAMSRFGQGVMRAGGIEAHYVPHGVNTAVFRPRDRAAARRALGWPTDRFIVGQVAMNQGMPSRKCFSEHIEAFATLKARHPDALLYLHTILDSRAGGVDIPAICAGFNLVLGRDVLSTGTYSYLMGQPLDWLAHAYSAFDVLLSASSGEGFGLPILEAQSCGTPVIVGGWSAMQELCFSGWMVDRSDSHPVWSRGGAFYRWPRVAAIAALLEDAYRAAGRAELRTRAREGARAFDVDTVVEQHWRPALEDIASRLPAQHAPAGNQSPAPASKRD